MGYAGGAERRDVWLSPRAHRQFFLDMLAAGGFFIVRGNKAIPFNLVEASDRDGRRLRHLEGKALSWEALPLRSVDVESKWGREARPIMSSLRELPRPPSAASRRIHLDDDSTASHGRDPTIITSLFAPNDWHD